MSMKDQFNMPHKKDEKSQNYINVPNDDTLPIGIQEVFAFGVTADHFCNSPLHLWETGEYTFCKERRQGQLNTTKTQSALQLKRIYLS